MSADKNLRKGASLPPGFIQAEGGVLRLDAWELPIPPLEYVADACSLEVSDDGPSLYFGQMGLGGTLMSVVGFTMPLARLKEISGGMVEIMAKLRGEYGANDEVPGRMTGVLPDRFRKYPAMVIRAALDQDWAMMDFYNMEVPIQRNIAKGQLPEVRGSIRIFLQPRLLQRLLNLITREVK